MRKIISVIGPNTENCTPEIYNFAHKLGTSLAENRYIIACGGREGIMEAVCKGAKESEHYIPNSTIGILPSLNKQEANPYCDIVIPTGIGYARNQIVVATGDAVVAIAGGSGTLSEITFAWQYGKPIICITKFDGWAKKVAGKILDNRRNEATLEAGDENEVIKILNTLKW